MKIAVINQKGGSGKTSTACLLALYYAGQGFKVLAVDCDPQGGLSRLFKVQGPGLFDLLTGGTYTPILSRGVHVVTGDHRLDKIAYTLPPYDLQEIGAGYDFTIIDTPPTTQGITRAAAFTSDKIIIPAEISEVTEGPTLFTLSELTRIKKTGKVLLIGKEPTKPGYKMDVYLSFTDKLKGQIAGFIPQTQTVKKIVAGVTKFSPSINTILTEITGRL